ncbi:unnamed protein product, partial [Amoebophrya sp. A25]
SLVVAALREAYAALDISDRSWNTEPEPTCCVKIHSVHVAFSHTVVKCTGKEGTRVEEATAGWETVEYVHLVSEMELVERQDFSQYLKNFFTDPDLLVGTLFRDAAQAVQDMHRMGWTHGDIKPENFLVAVRRNQQKLVLADFGNAMPAGQWRGRQTIGADKAYRDPELTYSNAVNAVAADCWSLGATFYKVAAYYCWGSDPSATAIEIEKNAQKWVSENMVPQTPAFRVWWFYRKYPANGIHTSDDDLASTREYFPPPFNQAKPARVRQLCLAGRHARAITCFMAVLETHAFNVDPEARSLEKLKKALDGIGKEDYREEALQLPPLPEAEAEAPQPSQPLQAAGSGTSPTSSSSVSPSDQGQEHSTEGSGGGDTYTRQRVLPGAIMEHSASTVHDEEDVRAPGLRRPSAFEMTINLAADERTKNEQETSGSVLEGDHTGDSAALHELKSVSSGGKDNEASALEVDHTKKSAFIQGQ